MEGLEVLEDELLESHGRSHQRVITSVLGKDTTKTFSGSNL